MFTQAPSSTGGGVCLRQLLKPRYTQRTGQSTRKKAIQPIGMQMAAGMKAPSKPLVKHRESFQA